MNNINPTNHMYACRLILFMDGHLSGHNLDRRGLDIDLGLITIKPEFINQIYAQSMSIRILAILRHNLMSVSNSLLSEFHGEHICL